MPPHSPSLLSPYAGCVRRGECIIEPVFNDQATDENDWLLGALEGGFRHPKRTLNAR